MDMDGQLLEGVPHSSLETALPRVGGDVKVVRGEWRDLRGKLLERDKDKETLQVQLYGEQTVVTLGFDDAAEAVGGLDTDDMM